jgi:hypothetical protein
MNEPKIDFSSLDPSRNVARFEARIAAIAEHAVRMRERRLTVTGQLLAWSRPMLAVAASVALFGWLSLMASGKSQVNARAQDPAFAISTWAANDEVPNTETVIAALGGSIGAP